MVNHGGHGTSECFNKMAEQDNASLIVSSNFHETLFWHILQMNGTFNETKIINMWSLVKDKVAKFTL